MKNTLFILAFLFFVLLLQAQKLPYQNASLTSEERAKDLLSRLTLVEKAQLMCDISEPIPRLGIKKFNWWSEALHGFTNNGGVTVLPEPIGMAASFDDKLVYRSFTAVSDEIRARYNESRRKGQENQRFQSLAVWTPNINIFRDPRWGRGQETYGEDPYLTSVMGVAVVKGLQGPDDSKYKKLLACAKHYAVHSGPEWSRHTLNINNITNRELWETYLPAFKAVVQEADVRQVMCAYQRLDDEPCCGSPRLLQRILREDWGYKHLVVSDCGAVADFWQNHKVSSDATHSAARASLAGTDVECGFGYAYDKLPDAVAKGYINEKDIDMNVLRVLKGRFDLGEMDEDELVQWSKIPLDVVDSKEHRELALEAARKSMTLLKNDKKILPLSKSVRRIAVIGPNATDERMLWGNYNGTPVKTITILDGIKTKLQDTQIYYEKGCDITDDKITESLIAECKMDGKSGIKATYWNNTGSEGNAVVTEQLTMPINLTTAGQHEFAPGVLLKGFSGKYETAYQATFTGELVFRIEAIGRFELFVNAVSVMKYDAWTASPTRIPFQVENGKEYKIELRFVQDHDWADAILKFNLGKEIPVDYNLLLTRLKGIDVVIFAGGISPQLEGEEMPVSFPGFKGGDRTDIELPASQRKCIQVLKDAGKKIILVNCSGSSMGLVPEAKNCDAILQAWYGGEAGGQAVADVLFGDYNPAGKLPITFYKNVSQLPDFENYSMDGRTYRFMKDDPLFPFGFGLSYTNFEIGKAIVSDIPLVVGADLKMTIPVKNVGKRDGAEVIQCYIGKVNDVDGPIKTLRAFKRMEIPAGKLSKAEITLPYTSFEFYDNASGKMKVTPGEYIIYYGNSSAINQLQSIRIQL